MIVPIAVLVGGSQRPGSGVPHAADRAAVDLAAGLGTLAAGYCAVADAGVLAYLAAAGAGTVGVLGGADDVVAGCLVVGPHGLARHGAWLAATLAEGLAATLVFDVVDVAAMSGTTVTVLRDLGAGERDELVVRLPAVLVVHPAAAPRRYLSRFRQRFAPSAAGRHADRLADPLEAVAGDWGPMRPRARAAAGRTADAEARANAAFGVETAPAGGGGQGRPIAADAATCAAHLLRYLGHHGHLPRPVTIAAPEQPPAQPAPESRPARPAAATPPAGLRPCGPPVRRPRRVGETDTAARHARQPRLLGTAGSPNPRPAVSRRPRLLGEQAAVRQARQPRLLELRDGRRPPAITSHVP